MEPRNLSPRSRVTLAPWLPRNDIITPNRVSPPGQVGITSDCFVFYDPRIWYKAAVNRFLWFVNIDTHKQRLVWACLALKTYSLSLWIYSSYHLELIIFLNSIYTNKSSQVLSVPPQVCHPNNKVGFLLSPSNLLFPLTYFSHLTFVKVFFSDFSTSL